MTNGQMTDEQMDNEPMNNGIRARCSLLIGSLFIFLLAACGKSAPTSLADFFPTTGAFPGWTSRAAVQTFDRDTIFDLVDGQADAFFAYGFEQVAVQRYENAEGAVLGIEIWQLATDADAYGLFAASIAGEPIAVGNEGDTDPGRRIIFWQGRYYAQVYGRQELPQADLLGFAQAVAAALPKGGERPALVDRLPQDGLVARGFYFFHEEISIQNDVWLGGENVLGLSQETDGVLGRYEFDGARARLLLVQYPGAEAASTGLVALQAGEVDGLIAADVSGDLLGAVFGEVDKAAAEGLLAQALGGE